MRHGRILLVLSTCQALQIHFLERTHTGIDTLKTNAVFTSAEASGNSDMVMGVVFPS